MSQFDRSSIVAYTSYQMTTRVTNPYHGQKGWAFYPEGFFGNWQPFSQRAKRSMSRQKIVTFLAGRGWIFDIEIRMLNTRQDVRPVGVVYAQKDPMSTMPSVALQGNEGYLATTQAKRVKVICG